MYRSFGTPVASTVSAVTASGSTPDRTKAVGWDARAERVATWVELTNRQTGRQVLVINTHLDHVGERARMRGAQLILDLVEDWPAETPMIILGDFNASPYRPIPHTPYTSRTFGLFAEAGFMDAYRSVTGVWPPPATFHNYQGERYAPDQYGTWYIDWPLTRNLRVLTAEIIRHRPEAAPLSDHYPVYGEVEHIDEA